MAASLPMGCPASLPTPPCDTISPVTMSSARSRPSAGGSITVAKSTLVNAQKTPNVNPLKDQCLRELSDHKSFTPESLDFLLDRLIDEFPLGLKIMPSNFLNVEFMSVEPLHAPNRFLAPVHHVADKGHWSLVYVSQERAERHRGGRLYFRAQHYDSIFSESRRDAVKKKLESWVERNHRTMELRFEQVSGPSHDQRFMSGPFIVMAARVFANYGTISPKSKTAWDTDPRKFITGILHGRREPSGSSREVSRETPQFVPKNTPGRQTEAMAPSTPSLAPSTKKNGDRLVSVPSYKEDIFTPKTPRPRVENGMRKSASPLTKALAREVTPKVGRMSCGPVDTPSEPNSKRRRIESDNPLAFNVSDKSSEFVSFASGLGLPPVASLKQESDKLIDELGVKKKAFEKKNQALNLSNKQYAQHKEDHTNVSQDCESLNTKINKQEQTMSDYIAKLPPVGEGMDVTDADLVSSVTATFQTVTTRLQDNLKGKLERKRKASEMLESVGQERATRQAEVAEAMKEKLQMDYETRKACEREELVAIMEDTLKKLEVWKENWDSANWLEAFLERRGRG